MQKQEPPPWASLPGTALGEFGCVTRVLASRVCEPECLVLVSLWADFAVFMSRSPARSLVKSCGDRKGRPGRPHLGSTLRGRGAFPPLCVQPRYVPSEVPARRACRGHSELPLGRSPLFLGLRGSCFICEGRPQLSRQSLSARSIRAPPGFSTESRLQSPTRLGPAQRHQRLLSCYYVPTSVHSALPALSH